MENKKIDFHEASAPRSFHLPLNAIKKLIKKKMQLWTDREAHYLPNFFFFKKANNFFLNDRFFFKNGS